MGRRGPTPKPTVIQMLKGDPGKRAKKRFENEPKPPGVKTTKKRNSVPCPKYLDKAAKKEWRRITKILIEMEAEGQKLLTEVDTAALAAYCQAYSDYQNAIREIEENGAVMTFYSEKGGEYQQQSPWVTIKNKAMEQMHKFAKEFGFTPASRSRVTLQEVKTDKKDKAKDVIGF